MNDTTPEIICIGSALWDVIGRAPVHMEHGADVPGRIERLPGGVALNIAIRAARYGLRSVVLSAVGRDPDGAALLRAAAAMGVDTGWVSQSEDLPTDRYMAVEGTNGLIAAVADTHSLERAGGRVLAPLQDGTFGAADSPYRGCVAIDGNLPAALLEEIAASDCFSKADLRIAPASPGKAERLLPFLSHPHAALYLNLEEAALLCRAEFSSAFEAVEALLARGAARVLVTDGAGPAAEGHEGRIVGRVPPQVRVARITGAGDVFMAAHIAAELRGLDGTPALEFALEAAAAHVGEGPET